jgi:O-glycosyl hydrolase
MNKNKLFYGGKFMRKKQFSLNWLTVLLLGAVLACAACSVGHEAMAEGDAKAPVITQQPSDQVVTVQGLAAGGSIAPVTVQANSPDGGTLSYQWYALPPRLESVPGGGEGEEEEPAPTVAVPVGTNSYSYTPTGLTEEGIYAYYVEITNTNNGVTGKKTNTIRSNVGEILIYNTDNAEYPTITEHPVGGEYELGPNMIIEPLSVTVEETPGGRLTYQWYRSMDGTNSGGLKIETADKVTYTPDFYGFEGTYYYYVEVNNFKSTAAGRKNSKRASRVATIVVKRVQTAATPVITVQPLDASYFTGDTIAPLTITATAADGGEISYQWVSTTNSSAAGDTSSTSWSTSGLTGAETDTLTPTVRPLAFYHVRVTNTNNLAVNKTASTVSRVVMVNVADPSTASGNATITVDTDNKRQFVRGFGGMSTPWGNAPDDNVRDIERMFNPDTGLGYNMIRIMIMPDNTDIEVTMRQLINNELSGDSDCSDYYEIVKIVNKYNGYVLASPWSPPAEWKSNNSINGSGAGLGAANLLPQHYQDYADYLKSFCQHMYNKGAPIYAVSIQNEPNHPADYAGCEWSPAEMRDFFKEVGRFTNGVKGWGGGVEIPRVLTMNGESANTAAINEPAVADPISWAAIDLFGRHNYGNQTITVNQNYSHVTEKKEVWMSERNINGGSDTDYPNDSTWNYVWRFMNDLDVTIRINEENAYIWWTIKRFYSMIGDGEYGTVEGTVLPRGHGLSHYAKFGKESWRVGVTAEGTTAGGAAFTTNNFNPSSGYDMNRVHARATAFMSEDGNTISIVMFTPTNTSGGEGIDMGNVKIQLPDGFTAKSAVAMRSNSSIRSRMESVALSADRNSAVVSLPASTILSVRFTK